MTADWKAQVLGTKFDTPAPPPFLLAALPEEQDTGCSSPRVSNSRLSKWPERVAARRAACLFPKEGDEADLGAQAVLMLECLQSSSLCPKRV